MRSKITTLGIGLAASALAAVSAGTCVAGAVSVTPPVVKKVTLTFGSDGATVLATKGELVEVKLSGHHLRWSEAQVIQSTPVLALVSAATTANGASDTVFKVINYGSAGLDATGTPICSAAAAAAGCPQYVLLWHATVDVPVVDPPGPVSG